MNVVAFPAFWNRALNPYNALLYEHLQPVVGGVHEYAHRAPMPRAVDIFHVHWPDRVILGGGALRASARAALFLARTALVRRRGARVVWTVHNLAPHEAAWPPLAARYWPAFLARVDGVIYLSTESRRQAEAFHPALQGKPAAVIPHGHYRPMIEAQGGLPARQAARRALGLPADKFIFLHFGLIRPYKNVPLLVREFTALGRDDLALVVAGSVVEADETATACRAAAAGAPNVLFDFRHLPDATLIRYLAAADVVVLPYRRVLNSGSILLALSAERPVIAPAIGSLTEIAQEVGPDWVRCYQGEFTGAQLLAAQAARMPEGQAPDLSRYDWPAIAAQTAAFYATLR